MKDTISGKSVTEGRQREGRGGGAEHGRGAAAADGGARQRRAQQLRRRLRAQHQPHHGLRGPATLHHDLHLSVYCLEATSRFNVHESRRLRTLTTLPFY